MTELNKFGVRGLLHFHKGILLSRVAEFPFEKRQHVQKDEVSCIRKKIVILILKVMIKNLYCCFCTKTIVLSLIMGVLEKGG